MKKRLAKVVVFTLLSGCCQLLAQPQILDLTTLARKTRPSVVLLTIYDDSDKEIALGTSFLISPEGFLITNYH